MQCECHLNSDGSIDPCAAHKQWADRAYARTHEAAAALGAMLTLALEVLDEAACWTWSPGGEPNWSKRPREVLSKIRGGDGRPGKGWSPPVPSSMVSVSLPAAVPTSMLLWCPSCGERHIDVGEFATKPHTTHACQNCGMVWKPALVPTVGVQFLPGYRNTP